MFLDGEVIVSGHIPSYNVIYVWLCVIFRIRKRYSLLESKHLSAITQLD